MCKKNPGCFDHHCASMLVFAAIIFAVISFGWLIITCLSSISTECYFGCFPNWGIVMISFIASFFIRVVDHAFRAAQIYREKGGECFSSIFVHVLFGCGIKTRCSCCYRSDVIAADYMAGLFIGWIEVAAYSFLIVYSQHAYIGAWLLFKTAHRIGYKKDIDRGHFNRYLLSNALVLLFAFMIACIYFHDLNSLLNEESYKFRVIFGKP